MSADPATIAGIALAIPGIIDLCIKYADFVAEKIEHSVNTEYHVNFRQLNIKTKLRDIRSQLDYLEKLSGADLIRFEYEIEELSLCARSLESTLESIQRRPSRLRWALRERQRVDALLKSVREAHIAFNLKLTVIIIEKSAIWNADRALTKREDGNFLPTPPIHAEQRELAPPGLYIHSIERRVERDQAPSIPMHIQDMLSTAQPLLGSDVKIVTSPCGGYYIVEERRYFGLDHEEIQATKERVRDVVATLHQSDPAIRELVSQKTSIAHCMGFVSNDRTQTLHLLFNTSSRAKTVNSLRRLLSSSTSYTLNERIQLARMIATAVLNTHNYRYVHKNIRPSNILCILEGEPRVSQNQPNGSLPLELGQALLVGYSDARLGSAGSQRAGPEVILDEIYVHKTRGHQDPSKNQKHSFLHDVYSLGVCLLEIGLWKSLIVPGNSNSESWVLNVKDFRFLASDLPDRQAFLEGLQNKFESVARYHLPRKVGQKYADVVVACLRRLDETEGNSKTSESDQDSVQVGFRYIDRIMRGLWDISI